MEKWTDAQVSYLIDNYKTMNYSDIAKQFNKTEASIRAKCFELNLVKNNRWTNEEIDYIMEHYTSKTNKELAYFLHRTETAVALKLKKLGIKRDLIRYNRDFFENIDTEEKAYWLGFIYADGWVTLDADNRGCLGIELQTNDISHLRKFNKSIGGNVEVKTRIHDGGCIDGRKIQPREMCYIRLFSEKMVHDLNKYGVVQKKTYDLSFPNNIPKNLVRHFIRGYFDGDGCIAQNKHSNGQTYVKCDFSGMSKSMIEELRYVLYQNNVNSYICMDKKNYRLYIGGMKNVDVFLHYMYDEATIYLDRKFEKKNRLYQELHIEQRLPR